MKTLIRQNRAAQIATSSLFIVGGLATLTASAQALRYGRPIEGFAIYGVHILLLAIGIAIAQQREES